MQTAGTGRNRRTTAGPARGRRWSAAWALHSHQPGLCTKQGHPAPLTAAPALVMLHPNPPRPLQGAVRPHHPLPRAFCPDPHIKDTGQPPSPSLPRCFLLPLESWLLTSFLAGKSFLLSSLPIACFHMFPVLLCSVCDWRACAPVHVRWGSSKPAPYSPAVARHACHLTATQQAPCPHPAARSTCRRVPSSGRDLPPKPLAETHTQPCRGRSPQPCAWLCPLASPLCTAQCPLLIRTGTERSQPQKQQRDAA